MSDYKDIFHLVNYFEKSTPIPPLPGNPDGYEWVDCRDLIDESLEWFNCGLDFPKARLIPSILSPYLYRGQVACYSPCYPKAYRGFPCVSRPRELSEEHRTKFLLSQIKTLWFISILKKHPGRRYAEQLEIQVNPVALAQHYGIPTHYLDLTQSIKVAAFFACCEYKDKVWQPKINGKGVIYRLRWGKIPEKVEIVGFSPFPRPGGQKSCLVPLRLGVDFEKIPYVEMVTFKHTHQGSAYFLKLFDNGKSLFLDDPASEIADSIMASPVVPINFVIHALLSFGCLPDKTEEGLIVFRERLLRYCKTRIEREVPIDFTEHHLQQLAIHLSKRKNDFLGNVRLVRDSKQED